MMAALRYEWLRVTTIRSTKIMLVLALVLSAGLSYLISGLGKGAGDGAPVSLDWYTAFGAPLGIAAILASVMGAQAIGQEYRFGLIRLTLTSFPRRAQILVAKIAVVVLAGVAVTAMSYLGSEIGLALHGQPVPASDIVAPDSTYFLRGLVYVVLWGLSAFAIAGVTRQTALGIAIPLVSGKIVEQLLGVFLVDRAPWLVAHLPWSSADRWLMSGGFTEDPVGWAAIATFAVWVAGFLLIQAVAFIRRDA
ncbi:MAG: hypothetical protein WCI29_06995 [Actinomycetes bacterium]